MSDALPVSTWTFTRKIRMAFLSFVLQHVDSLLDRLCGLVVRVLGYRSGGPGSIPETTKKKVVGLERGPLSLVSTTEGLHCRKVAAPVYKTENTAVGIRHSDHVAPFIRKSWQSLRQQAAVARSVGVVRSWTQTMEFSF
jgi:hypothetical protein